MTSNMIGRTMRHIPEEELHAYLDQALSRSQCVEIESHLAGCPVCRGARDSIAALRDRTTALLASLAPAGIRPPSYAKLSKRHSERAARRRRRWQRAAWAASVLLALGIGWSSNQWTSEEGRFPDSGSGLATTPAPRPAIPTARPASVNETRAVPAVKAGVLSAPATDPAVTTPPANPSVEPSLSATAVPAGASRSLELTASDLPTGGDPVAGLWRSLSWDGAQAEAGTWVPRVEGLPVVGVQVQSGGSGGDKPLMVVTQQLASGQMIRTVEGPAASVSSLLSKAPGQSVTADLLDIAAGPNGRPASSQALDGGAPRMLAIFGQVPSDSLRAFLLKVR